MTNEDAFKVVAKHLLEQNEQSFADVVPPEDEYDAPRPMCAYRGDDGRKCAIGILIPDDEYSAEFEGWGVHEVKEKVSTLWNLNVDLLDELQDIHDNYQPFGWKDLLDGVALKYGFEELP